MLTESPMDYSDFHQSCKSDEWSQFIKSHPKNCHPKNKILFLMIRYFFFYSVASIVTNKVPHIISDLLSVFHDCAFVCLFVCLFVCVCLSVCLFELSLNKIDYCNYLIFLICFFINIQVECLYMCYEFCIE